MVGLWPSRRIRTVHHSLRSHLRRSALVKPCTVRGTQRGLAGQIGCSYCARLRIAGAQPRTRGCGAAAPLPWRAAIRCCGPRRAARSQVAARQTTRLSRRGQPARPVPAAAARRLRQSPADDLRSRSRLRRTNAHASLSNTT